MTGIIAFHAASAIALLVTGFLALRPPKRRRSPHRRLGEAYFWLLAVALGSGMLVGAHAPALSAFEFMTLPTFAMGLLGYVMARRRRPWLGQPWLAWHIRGQGGSYIGVVTATLFQIVPRVAPASPVVTVLLWALPTIVGSTLIARTVTRRLSAPGPLRAAVALDAGTAGVLPAASPGGGPMKPLPRRLGE